MHEACEGIYLVKISLDEIMFPKDKNPDEYIYSLQEIIDGVLDLPSSKSMVFRPNRNDLALGIIARID